MKKEENIGKPKLYKEENKYENANIGYSNNINNQEQPNKINLLFSMAMIRNKKSETKLEIKNEKPTQNMFDALKEKFVQNNQKLNDKEETKKEIPDINRSISMKTKSNKNPLNKRFSDMQYILANKMDKGMIMGTPKPKPEGEIIEHNASADKDQSTYEDVIKSSKSLVKKKKPKRNDRFGVVEEHIPIQIKPFQDEGNKIPEGNEENKPKENNKQPKNEEQNLATNKVNDAHQVR